MACRRRGTAWRRAAAHLLHTPAVLLLALVGVAVLVLGLTIGQAGGELGVFFAHAGVWILVLGLLVPLCAEVELGPGGLKLKTALRERDELFQEALERHEPTTIRFAQLLVGDASRARELTELAWTHAYGAWHTLGAEHVRLFVVCTLCRLVVRSSWAHPWPSPGDEEASGWASALSGLPARTRAAVLLYDYEMLPVRRIAWVLDCSEEQIRIELAARDTVVASSVRDGWPR